MGSVTKCSKEDHHEANYFIADCHCNTDRPSRLQGDRIPAQSSRGRPIFVTQIPAGYRDWRLVSVAHEEGNLKDIRAILGNDVAIKTYREGKLPFPEGAIIGRIAWYHIASEENNKAFGRAQSFVAGSEPPWYLQFMVKDSKKYAATGGWGYAQFDKDGKPGPEADQKDAFPATRLSKIATSSSPVTRLDNENHSRKE